MRKNDEENIEETVKEEEIVAKALDGQRYPLPLCESMWVSGVPIQGSRVAMLRGRQVARCGRCGTWWGKLIKIER